MPKPDHEEQVKYTAYPNVVLSVPREDWARLKETLRESFPGVMSPRQYELKTYGVAIGEEAFRPAHEVFTEK